MSLDIRSIILTFCSFLFFHNLNAQTIVPARFGSFQLVSYDDDTTSISQLINKSSDTTFCILVNGTSCKDCVTSICTFLKENDYPFFVIIGGCNSYSCINDFAIQYQFDKKSLYYDIDMEQFGSFDNVTKNTPFFKELNIKNSPIMLAEFGGQIEFIEYSQLFIKGTSKVNSDLKYF